MTAVGYIVRAPLSAAAGITVLFGTITFGCDDIGDVSSWDRCHSVLLRPIVEWPGNFANTVIPVALGLAAGTLAWWLLGQSQRTATATATAGIVVVGTLAAFTRFVGGIFTT